MTCDFDLPKDAPLVHETNIAAVDKGYHNLYSVARKNSSGGFDFRCVTKRHFDLRSGRVVIRKKSELMTTKAQRADLLKATTATSLKTVNPTNFRLALDARRDSYSDLYGHQSNRRFKKEKLAARMKEQRAIDEVIRDISWGGTVLNVFGDCSKTTGFRNSTPGGPLKKIEALMVKRGYAVCEEKEAYSTKSSLCCHGHLNKCMKNGQPVETFKKGKYIDEPTKMPRQVHGILICQKRGTGILLVQ